MKRARAKAIHQEVNSLLSTYTLNTSLDGMLPHADILCVLRYEPREKDAAGDPTLDNEEGEEGLQSEAFTQDRHCWPQDPGAAGLDTLALPAYSPRHYRP
jgi:hypothetical protein